METINLNPKLFDKDVEQLPIRKGYGDGLFEAGKLDPRVVALCADLTGSTMTSTFSKVFPERFVQVGIGEQSMASVASGMAAMGKIPFLASYAMFSPGRNWEQIRTTICYNDRNVKIGGAHAGISVGPDGGTHQAIEDIAITRVIPRMTVITPCDAIEAKKATLAAAKMVGPVYIRLAREKTPVMTTEETPFEIGKAQYFFVPSGAPQVGIIAIGALVYNAIMAAKELEAEGIMATVLNLGTVKPLDEEKVIELVKAAGAIVTVEEHQIIGGMGSAVAQVLSEKQPTPIEFIGVRDVFGQSGEPNELIEHYGMGISHIKEAAKKVIARK
ncbi:transketolase [Candidatus Azambacteria bacterium RIFCSPHIGHO2_02_FULL_52_12]|uniref:Transketolase n=1 Tax=Candidatus Azambacteria bacterium RIFCSPLOWO2_01_FULL_46_25 TaxID=1797298 RepID=A0A1F5BVX8_9BACT|nr:MAG: transketolase [Candidatus Azambacteria bacterium RIFCSPHIGHO2_02_FULL_52_12]OGD34761.1 MAG: transketolase [Candidatus Azambacteria bacterium RIFCSPLOWO2_01_FULL_46_25]OGD37886.1 MAG: transketolase [Candidatus Azambacteria bacterium RIFCSPHIGHO2_01_FULL_51_74]